MKEKISSKQRLHQLDVPLYAITGSIGTGKSLVTDYLLRKGHPCLDADRLIHLIYQHAETQSFIANLGPEFVRDGDIDFAQLRQAFFSDNQLKEKVQSHLYSQLPKQFIKERGKLGKISYLFYDVPLLFEKDLQDKFDCIIVVYCSHKEQVKRIMERDQMPLDLTQKMISSQMDIEAKCKQTDYVLENTTTKEDLYQQVDQLLEQLI